MIPSYFIILAILFRMVGGAKYFMLTVRGRTQPNIVSWALWSLTAIIAFIAQMYRGVGIESLVTLAIGIGPLAVVFAGLRMGGYKVAFTRLDISCLLFALVGIVLWIKTSDPFLALIMSIIADIFSSIPTIVKSYLLPETESASSYFFSILSMIVTLLTITRWEVMNWMFPLYILCINLTFVMLIILSKRIRFTRQVALLENKTL